MGLSDGYAPQNFADRGGLYGRLLSLRPDLAPDQQPAQGQPSSLPAQQPQLISMSGPEASAIGNALADFYRQTILQPAKDIAGYVNDAANDPACFAHAIAPSFAGLGPVASQLPAVVRGAIGAIGFPGSTAPRGRETEEPTNESEPGNKPASTPIGRRGEPIAVKPGTNRPFTVGDRTFTGHAGDQMQGRGVPPSPVEDAIRNGQTFPGKGPGETVHIGSNGVIVVTGADGQVITVITGKL